MSKFKCKTCDMSTVYNLAFIFHIFLQFNANLLLKCQLSNMKGEFHEHVKRWQGREKPDDDPTQRDVGRPPVQQVVLLTAASPRIFLISLLDMSTVSFETAR